MTASTESSTQSHHDEKEAIAPARLVAYALGNFGQSAFYNALSTYFVVYVTNSLFSGVDKAVAGKLIGIITSLIVIIRIAEIFVDPLLGNLVDNTTTKLGRFRPWQLIGGLVSAVLIVMVYTGLFGLVNVNTTLFIVLFVVVFVVLDVFYSLRDISYWGMIPSISSDSHQRGIYTAAALSALLPVVFETVLSELLSVSAVFSSDCSSLSAVCSLLSGVSTELIETLLSA